MLRRWTVALVLLCVLAVSGYAQGLTTNASKDDWEEINFEFNSAILSDGYPSLLRLADLLRQHTGYHVKVEGNTDNIGSTKFNEKLGFQRASTVKDFLVKYGAAAGQVDVATRGKNDPKYPGYKNGYSKTDVSRWMNRRVVLTVTDENGKTVGAGGAGDVIRAIDQTPGKGPQDCCTDILKRLDKLDDIARMLQQLMDANANLRKDLDNLKNQQAALENKVATPTGPKPLTAEETGQIVDKKIKDNKDPRFALLGMNAGADDMGNITFTGKGRYFAPFAKHYAFQAEAEYMYFHTQREGQFDFGLVDRIGNFQAGLFSSFKHVDLAGMQQGGTLGQGSVTLDYIFKLGKVGLFGTKGFLNNALVDRRNATFVNGVDGNGNPALSIAPNLFVEKYLSIVDQVGVATSLGLWGNNYLEANIGYLKSIGHADRPGGTLRFIFPLNTKLALTAEGGVNETLIGPGNTGRAVFGVQFGNFMRPKEYLESSNPVPAQIPRVRYEVLSRTVKNGGTPPIADAGPDQIGVPAGTITLNGSNSRDPNGLPLTYQWIQEAGPVVSLSAPTTPITTFTAAAGQSYSFRLTVKNSDNLSASARVRVTTVAGQNVQILFFIADPTNIQGGQSTTLSWKILNADSATITPVPGPVNPSAGSTTVAPANTTTYTLTAKNATSQDTATVTVVVTNPTPRLAVCTAVPMNINQGESSTLFYQTLNADTVTITPGVGSVAKNGSVVVTPTTNTNYTITATNAFGSDTCSVAVQVTAGTAPRIIRFTASPLTIASGATSTLVWQVENATKVDIEPVVGTVALVGTADVKPAQTQLYTLTATNNFGSVSATVTVTVVPPNPTVLDPVITSFTANPPASTNPGSPVVLTCLAQNATKVTISGIGDVDANGNRTVNPTTTTTYVCVATNSVGKQVSQNLTVPVTTGGGGGTPPVIVVTSPSAQCTVAPVIGGTVVCQTLVRLLDLDLSGSSSPLGNNPLSFFTTSRSISAVVLNPTSPKFSVQLSELFGDYFFDVVVTDSKGNKGTATIDIQYLKTTHN